MKRSFEEHFDTALTETIDGESMENIDTKTTESNKKPRISAQFDKILKRSVLTNCNQFEICNFQELNVQKPLIDLFLKTSHTPLQEALFNHLNSYKDVAYTNLSQDCTEITRLVALHSLNHVLKSRDLVVKNTNKLKLPENANSSFCDQGFTRPRVLILVPFRHHAFEIVKTMVDISGFKKLDNYDRFIDEFTSEAQDNPNRPPDFLKTFAGNIDDNFKVGIQFAGKRMRLYSGFYSSDLIIASPLGLKVTMHDKSGSAKDSDYLSSIEVVIMHHSQIFQMQNWDHLRSVFSRLNLIPKESHDCDFSRVRPYILDGQLKNVRQNVYFSTMQTPELNALESSFFTNYSGKIKLTQEIHGQLEQITLKLPLIFQRIPTSSLVDSHDTRFKYLTTKAIPSLYNGKTLFSNILLVVPSYFDFVRIRNYLAEKDMPFSFISEYSSKSDVDTARYQFRSGESKILLYSERAHFFRRYMIKGARHLLFYQPPLFEFYAELVNLMEPTQDASCSLLFSIFDQLALERIVGSQKLSKILKSKKEAFMFSL